jgi:hypothetical protein
MCSSAWAAFLVSDPTPAEVFQITIDGDTFVLPAQPDGSLRLDLSEYAGANIEGTISCGREWHLNGVSSEIMEWGNPVPFVLSGGAISTTLPGLRIVEE